MRLRREHGKGTMIRLPDKVRSPGERSMKNLSDQDIVVEGDYFVDGDSKSY